jgi:putative membrane protein
MSEIIMNFLSDFIKGMIIGIGAVAPGVSGGTFAVILGIYKKLTDAIANIFNDFRKKVIMLFPLGLGAGVGVLLFSKIMKYLFENYNSEVKYLFIGLMIGTLPAVFKEANKKGFKKSYILPCIITFGITILFIILENGVINIIPEGKPGLIELIIYGAITGFGTIVPGISSSFILMYIGAYEVMLDAIVNFDLMLLIPIGIGFVLSILMFAKLISLLFKKVYGYTYYAVLGFVIGSIITIFPGIEFNLKYLIGILLCVIGFYLSFSLTKYAKDEQESYLS